MAFEKTTYNTGDTLTAKKVNDIQDAIIDNEKKVAALSDKIGNGIVVRSLYSTIEFSLHGEKWNISTGFYYQDVPDGHEDYAEYTTVSFALYPVSSDGGLIKFSQPMNYHKTYYVEIQSYPKQFDVGVVYDGYALVTEVSGDDLTESVVELFRGVSETKSAINTNTEDVAEISETLAKVDEEINDVVAGVAGLNDNVASHYHRYNFSTKKWIAYGDSITDSDFSGTTKYVEVLGEYFKFASVSNYGLASSNIAYVKGETVQCGVDIYEEHKEETADLITIFYGTNDWFNSVPVGTYTDIDTGTLFGAFNTIIKDIKTRQPDCEIIIITPIWRDWAGTSEGGTLPYSTNGNGVTFETFVDEIEKIAKFHGVPCVNLYELLGVRQYSVNDTTPLHYTIDSLHPNQTGQYRIANVLKPLVEQRVLLSSNPDEVYEVVYNIGETSLPTRIIEINDLVDMTRGQTASLDTTNNQAIKPEGNNYIVVFKDSALNFILKTSANSTLFFNLWANGDTGYGFAFNKNVTYKGLCFNCNFSTGVTSTYNSYATNKNEWSDLNIGVNTLHFIYDTADKAWNVYEIVDDTESLAASVSKDNFGAMDLSNNTPLFAVASCYDARPFTLIK